MRDGIVVDHHGLLALGSGNRQLCGYLAAVHEDPMYAVAVPALCLAEAARTHPGILVRLARLPAVDVSAVDGGVADSLGRMAAHHPGRDLAALHAVCVSLATGWEILTTLPGEYKGLGVHLMPVQGWPVQGC